MADIRIVQPRGSHLWIVVTVLSVVGILLWASAFVVGDPTAPDELPRVGAAADFGALRGPVLPVETVPFPSIIPLQTRDLGRMVHVTGVAESQVAANSVWIRTPDGYRILVRFEPAPSPELLQRFRAGSTVDLDGYLHNIALAEFHQIIDSLQVRLPRPPPARKFGDLPDPSFARVDSLFIKNYYISVRPGDIAPDLSPEVTS